MLQVKISCNIYKNGRSKKKAQIALSLSPVVKQKERES